MKDLDDIFRNQLGLLYGAETERKTMLATMARAAAVPAIKTELDKAIVENATHINRLDEVFRSIGDTPKAVACKSFDGLMQNCEPAVPDASDAHVRYAGLMAMARDIQCNEIAGYGNARGWAYALGHDTATRLLQQTLDEERASTTRLVKLAEFVYPAATRLANVEATRIHPRITPAACTRWASQESPCAATAAAHPGVM